MGLDDYANSYYSLTSLDEEMAGNHFSMRRLCYQGEIINQIRQIAEPASRHPRDMVAGFFKKFEEDGNARAVFEQGVEQFIIKLQKRAADKRKEETEQIPKDAAPRK